MDRDDSGRRPSAPRCAPAEGGAPEARSPGWEQKRVNVDFPVWMIRCLDREAKRLGVPRQSLIKVWIAERLKALPDAP